MLHSVISGEMMLKMRTKRSDSFLISRSNDDNDYSSPTKTSIPELRTQNALCMGISWPQSLDRLNEAYSDTERAPYQI